MIKKKPTVHNNLCQVAQQLVSTVLARFKVEQLRVGIDERSVYRAVHKVLVFEYVDQVRNVGLDATNAELLERAQHLGTRGRMVLGVGDNLNQQRVVVGCDHCACECVCRVDTDAHAFTATVDFNAAIVRLEVLSRIFL